MTLVKKASRTARVPEDTVDFCRHNGIGKGVSGLPPCWRKMGFEEDMRRKSNSFSS